MLEPVVAFGSRMSWAGLLRPGDPFVLPVRSRLVTLSSATEEPLHRAYGAWSERHRRFSLNLNHPRVRVQPRQPGESNGPGLDALVHWVPQAAVLGAGEGSVCHADGWPPDLWSAIVAATRSSGEPSMADRLRALADRPQSGEAPVITQWRELLTGEGPAPEEGTPLHGHRGWIPVPIPLDTGDGRTVAVLSWAPTAHHFRTLSEGLETLPPGPRFAGLVGQLRYHAECSLAELHGVRFHAGDAVADRKFEARPEYRAVFDTLHGEERAWVEDPDHGQLDGFDARSPDGTPLAP